ncbi:AEC family transporter [Colwellia sp. MSW7]|uniref:AEC family transporter n=1 Tax=Colwellia maritima TaxID=2912588 RepID=A0ABS9X5K8_9GAMM|nr:AEC family transporter [Colwellia maritima]MCI2285489.1 AEC family transporter [Colwellia maritima]
MEYNQGIFALLPVALSITAPIFILISLGAWLCHIKFINDEFIHISSKFIFNIGLPIILFTKTAAHDFKHLINVSNIAIMAITTMLVYFLSGLTAGKFIGEKRDKGVFVQGSFRGNLIILGLAFCANAYPEKGIAIATIPTAITIIMYNLLSIYTLNNSLHHQGASLKKNIVDILKNPLIIGIMVGLLANLLNFKTPDIIAQSNQYIAKMTLPLALIAIGGSLNFLQIKQNIKTAFAASLWKVIISPNCCYFIATYPHRPYCGRCVVFASLSTHGDGKFGYGTINARK